MTGSPWTTHELDTLTLLAGDVPWPVLPRIYWNTVRYHGYPSRTPAALRHKCDELGLSRAAIGNWVNAGLICTLMEVSYESITAWRCSGILPGTRYGDTRGHRYYYKRSDLHHLARTHPHLFGGLSFAALTQLFDDARRAKRVVELGLPKLQQCRPVLCVETGKVYPSLSAAARAVYVTTKCISVALDHPTKTSASLTWRSVPLSGAAASVR